MGGVARWYALSRDYGEVNNLHFSVFPLWSLHINAKHRRTGTRAQCGGRSGNVVRRKEASLPGQCAPCLEH